MSGYYFKPLSRVFLNLSGGTVTGETVFTQGVDANSITGQTIFSGDTNLEEIIRSLSAGSGGTVGDITRVQPGTNILIGGTDNNPIVNVVDSPIFSSLIVSGESVMEKITAVFISGNSVVFENITGNSIYSNFINSNTVVATLLSGDSISINSGEVMTRIPNSQDFQLFGNQSSTGVIYFEGLSGNTNDNSKFDIGSVSGWIVDNNTDPFQPVVEYVNFSGTTGSNPNGITLDYLATNPVTYIGLSGSSISDIIQSTSPFTPTQLRDILELGVVVHSNNTSVNVVNNHPTTGIDSTLQLYDLINALGFFNIGDGSNIYSSNNSNLSIDKTDGFMFANGSNYINDSKNPHIKYMPSGGSITFRYRLQDSTEYSDTVNVDPDNYDNNGILTPVPDTKYTIQRITLFTSNISRLQYGQNIYDSLDDAEAFLSTEDFNVESNIEENGLLRGFLIIRKGVTTLDNIKLSKFIIASHLGNARDTVVGDVHRTEILNSSSTGLRKGGELLPESLNTFQISAGSGVIVDNVTDSNEPRKDEVIWGNITNISLTNIATSVATVIMLDNLGNVIQFPLQSPPSQNDKRNKILLGVVAHSDRATVTNFFNGPIHITSPINQLEDLSSSIGPFSVEGNQVLPIAGTAELLKTGGKSYYYGGNFQINESSPSVLPTPETSGSTTASEIGFATGADIFGLSGFSIDTENYDPSGLGVVTEMNNNKFSAHRIWHIPLNNILVFQYGQEQYNSLNLAVGGFSTEAFIKPPGLSLGAYIISVVITKKGETDLSDTDTTKLIQQGPFGGEGGGGGSIADTLQTAYLNSEQPEITTDNVRGSVDFRVGSGSDLDKLVTFLNTNSDLVAWINGNGDVNFNSISATTMSATTYYGDGSNLTGVPDYYTTAATIVSQTAFFDRIDLASAYTLDLSGLVVSGTTDFYTTAATLNNNVISFDRIDQLSAYTVDLSSLVVSGTTDYYTTGVTLDINNVLTFNRNDVLSAYTVDLSSLSVSGSSILVFDIDDIDYNLSYIGYGTENACKIQQVNTFLNGNYSSLWASGNQIFDKSWSARTTYSYF